MLQAIKVCDEHIFLLTTSTKIRQSLRADSSVWDGGGGESICAMMSTYDWNSIWRTTQYITSSKRTESTSYILATKFSNLLCQLWTDCLICGCRKLSNMDLQTTLRESLSGSSNSPLVAQNSVVKWEEWTVLTITTQRNRRKAWKRRSYCRYRKSSCLHAWDSLEMDAVQDNQFLSM